MAMRNEFKQILIHKKGYHLLGSQVKLYAFNIF